MSKTGFGDGDYTDGYSETNQTVATDEFQHPLLTPGPVSTARALLVASTAAHDLVDQGLGEVADAQHLQTATDGHLDALAALVGVEPASDTDSHYRARIRASGGLTAKRATYEGVHSYVEVVLEADSSAYALSRPSGGVLDITAETATWDDATLTRSEILDFVTELLPEGHRAEKTEATP